MTRNEKVEICNKLAEYLIGYELTNRKIDGDPLPLLKLLIPEGEDVESGKAEIDSIADGFFCFL